MGTGCLEKNAGFETAEDEIYFISNKQKKNQIIP